jgi:hypothetical protein
VLVDSDVDISDRGFESEMRQQNLTGKYSHITWFGIKGNHLRDVTINSSLYQW